jgi:hypothetical protein
VVLQRSVELPEPCLLIDFSEMTQSSGSAMNAGHFKPFPASSPSLSSIQSNKIPHVHHISNKHRELVRRRESGGSSPLADFRNSRVGFNRNRLLCFSSQSVARVEIGM